jgi:hypothetical protein
MTTTIWDKVNTLYENSHRDFYEDFKTCLETGYVFVGPDYFLMGYPVENCGWFVLVGIGELGKLISLMPYHLPYVGFARDATGCGEVKWYLTSKLKQRYEKNRT